MGDGGGGTARRFPRWLVTVKLHRSKIALIVVALLPLAAGCSLFPEARQRDRIHNPFPQLKRVAVLPFFNQSSEPTVDTELVAEKYYAALQAVPGFEVLPIGVTKAQWLRYTLDNGEPEIRSGRQRSLRCVVIIALRVHPVSRVVSRRRTSTW